MKVNFLLDNGKVQTVIEYGRILEKKHTFRNELTKTIFTELFFNSSKIMIFS